MEGSPDVNLCSDCSAPGHVALWQIGVETGFIDGAIVIPQGPALSRSTMNSSPSDKMGFPPKVTVRMSSKALRSLPRK